MFLKFVIKYKNELRKVSKKYGLKSNWITQDNFYLRHYFLFSKIYNKRVSNGKVSDREMEKMRLVNTAHKYNSKHHEEYWGSTGMPLEHLDSLLCGWIALSVLDGESQAKYLNHKIEKSKLNIFSKKYLENKIKNLEKNIV